MSESGYKRTLWDRASNVRFTSNSGRKWVTKFMSEVDPKEKWAVPEESERWLMTTLREKLVKSGAKLVRHGCGVTFQLAEIAVPRNLFREILRRINELRRRPAPA